MKIAILGAGALGCYYGAKLAVAGEDVSFIMRSAYEPTKQHGLQIHSKDGNFSLPTPSVFRSSNEIGPVDLVILTWKSTSNGELKNALPPLLGNHTRLITLQNGMGNAEFISQLMPLERIYIGLCFVCAMMPKPGEILHLDGGSIQFAPAIPFPNGFQEAKDFARLFAQAKLQTLAFEQAEQIQWCKLTWNIPFNGLCLAHGGISINQLFSMPDQVKRAETIVREVCLAAEMRGFPLPEDIVKHQMESTAAMGDFIPSSAVDYIKKRPIEYEAIWGTPLRLAREAHAPVPYWEELCRDIQARFAFKN